MNDSSTKLLENQHIKELFSILKENGKGSAGLTALIMHVYEMENFVKRAEDKISDMKSQLAEIKEVQAHPVKAQLSKATNTLEIKVAEVKEQLSELKNSIILGCKNAVNSFKEKGITALDKLASFFKIKDSLQELKTSIDNITNKDDKAIAKIEAFAAEYHSAGRAISNMARVAVGKEPLGAKKEIGKLANTLAAPYKAQKSVLTSLKISIDKAITKLEKLEVTASEKQTERENVKKPSLLGQLQKNQALVDLAKRNAPVNERIKSKEAGL